MQTTSSPQTIRPSDQRADSLRLRLAIVGATAWALAWAQPSTAATWHVDSQTTINAALAGANPGDVIVVKNGTYDFPVRINGKHGTAANPITFQAESIGGVTFTGSSLGDSAKLRLERDYWTLDGFNFDNVKIPGTSSSDKMTVVRLRGASNNVLRNLTIVDCGLSSPNPADNASNNTMFLHLTLGSKNNVVERSQFLNNNKNIVVRVGGGATDPDNTDNLFRYNYWSGHAGFETLQLSWGSSADVAYRTTVEHNLWKDNASSSELVSSKSSQNVFRYNTFDHNNDQLVLRAGDDNVVDSNYFLNGRGIRAYGSGHTVTNNYFEGFYGPETGNLKGGMILGAGRESEVPYEPFRDALVANNTIVNTGDFSLIYGQFYGSTVSGAFIDTPPSGNEIRDNLIVNNAGQAIRRENNAPDVSNQWSGNVVWSTGSGTPGYTPPGVGVGVDPGLVLDPVGFRESSQFPLVGAQLDFRPLTVSDVGPGSTYLASFAGDFDGDNVVDGRDFLAWQRNHGGFAAGDAADLAVWRDRFGRTYGGAIAATTSLTTQPVPEPPAATLAALAFGMLATAGLRLVAVGQAAAAGAVARVSS